LRSFSFDIEYSSGHDGISYPEKKRKFFTNAYIRKDGNDVGTVQFAYERRSKTAHCIDEEYTEHFINLRKRFSKKRYRPM